MVTTEGVPAGNREFKLAARRFASGVTVVTTVVEEGCYGVTVSSFASLSVSPLLVSVSISTRSPMIKLVRRSGRFGVSVLTAGQQHVSRYFTRPDRGIAVDFLPEVPTVPATSGVPIVADCLSYFDCDLHRLLPGGDHVIMVGRVVSAGGRDGSPLVYFDGGYRSLDDHQRSADVVEAGLSLLDLRPGELVEAQRAVEPPLAALAAAHATPTDLASLEGLLEQARGCTRDPVRSTQLGLAFHLAIADLAGNRPLRATLAALQQLERGLMTEHTHENRAEEVLRIHEEILDSLGSGDPDRAATAMSTHVHEMTDRLPI